MSPRAGKGTRKRRIRRPSRPKPRSGIGSTRSRRSAGIGSSRSRRSSGTGSSFRPGSYRRKPVRRPVWRPRGHSYPRRYRSRPMSSCSCLCVFVILAISLVIAFAPTFIFTVAPEYSLVILIGVGVIIVLIAVLFISALDIFDDGDTTPSVTGDTMVVERERVLVVCPYCGTKNEQGIPNCTNCDGML